MIRMCRYAFNNYKQQFACFQCRKVFKKVTFQDYLEQRSIAEQYAKLRDCKSRAKRGELEAKYGIQFESVERNYQEEISRCPDCANRMANMGMDFKAPKRTDTKAWKIVEGMYQIGAIYQTCGCNGFGYVPTSQSDYRRYLRATMTEYETQLAMLEKNDKLSAFQRQTRSAYWTERIHGISQVILKAS